MVPEPKQSGFRTRSAHHDLTSLAVQRTMTRRPPPTRHGIDARICPVSLVEAAPTRSPRDLALCSADTPSSTAPIDQDNCHPVGRCSTGNCGIAAWSTRSIGPHGLPVPTSCKAQFTRHHAVLQRTILCSTLLTGRAAHNPLREGFPAPHRPPTASMTEYEADGLLDLRQN